MEAISEQTNKLYFKLMIQCFSCKKNNKVLVLQSESDIAKKKKGKRVLERQKKKLSRGKSVGR